MLFSNVHYCYLWCFWTLLHLSLHNPLSLKNHQSTFYAFWFLLVPLSVYINYSFLHVLIQQLYSLFTITLVPYDEWLFRSLYFPFPSSFLILKIDSYSIIFYFLYRLVTFVHLNNKLSSSIYSSINFTQYLNSFPGKMKTRKSQAFFYFSLCF